MAYGWRCGARGALAALPAGTVAALTPRETVSSPVNPCARVMSDFQVSDQVVLKKDSLSVGTTSAPL